MNKKMIKALGSLGIEIDEIKYNYPADAANFGFEAEEVTKFTLKGGYRNENRMSQLIDHLVILQELENNKNKAVNDLFDKLKTASGLTKK